MAHFIGYVPLIFLLNFEVLERGLSKYLLQP